MKRLMLVVLAFAAVGVFASSNSATDGKKAPRKITPEIKARLMARTGGMVKVRADGPEFLFVNAQKLVATDAVKKVPEELENVLRFPVSIRDEEIKDCPLKAAAGFLDFKTAAVVVIVDDDKLATSVLTAPEGKWAIINVGALKADKPVADVLAARVRKEMWRTFTMLLGGGNTQNYGCLMKPVYSIADLDELPYETVSPDPFMFVCRSMDKLGMKRNRSATYRKACEEGWAPPPETEMQKKIVEEVKAAAANK